MSSAAGEEWDLPPEVSVRAPVRPDGRARAMGLAYGVEPPMTDDEYKRALENMRAVHMPPYEAQNPHRCVFNEAPKHSGVYHQCTTLVPDPRELRYCMEHAKKIGYPLTPEQLERCTDAETKIRIKSLSSKAVAQIERVMDDIDAPAGVRLRASETLLNRSGHHEKASLEMNVEATIVDLSQIIRDRLSAKRAQLTASQITQETPDGEIVDAEVIPDPPAS